MRTVEEIKIIAAPLLDRDGLFLVDLTVSKDNVIEMYIDSLTGVNVSTCIGISKEIEAQLNREEEDFELTVSSAGIGYPFKVAGQYLKNIGKQVEMKLNDNTKIEGVLLSYNGQEIEVEVEEKVVVEGKKRKEIVKACRTIALDGIKQIKDTIVF